tara:strand:+ start:234 stop:797 length:564 start_codon:yes stop_codon:yes gene_type:complete
MKLRTIGILTLSLIIFAGCATGGVSKKDPSPKWYSNPDKYTDKPCNNALCGYGTYTHAREHSANGFARTLAQESLVAQLQSKVRRTISETMPNVGKYIASDEFAAEVKGYVSGQINKEECPARFNESWISRDNPEGMRYTCYMRVRIGEGDIDLFKLVNQAVMSSDDPKVKEEWEEHGRKTEDMLDF